MIEFDYTLITVIIGGSITGLLSGVLGVFTLLRKQSLLGDTISHAALPGIAIAFLLTQIKHPLILILGAIFAGWLGTLFISWVNRNSKVKEDAVMAVVLSGFFGFGLTLMTLIQKIPDSNQAGLNRFLFGNAATMLREDIIIMGIFAVISFVILILFWKEFKLSTFDPDFTKAVGFPVVVLDTLLLSVIVIAITTGLQSVGVVLMSALLVAPAAAARQWTDNMLVMTILAAFFGMIASIGGAILSSLIQNLPTGPTIVLIITVIVIISIFFAPNRGILWKWFRRYKNRGELALVRIIEQLLFMAEHHEDKHYPHEIKMLRAIFHEKIDKYIFTLHKRGIVNLSADGNMICLTEKGFAEAPLYLKSINSNEGKE